MNCINCGAPVTRLKCLYCGTRAPLDSFVYDEPTCEKCGSVCESVDLAGDGLIVATQHYCRRCGHSTTTKTDDDMREIRGSRTPYTYGHIPHGLDDLRLLSQLTAPAFTKRTAQNEQIRQHTTPQTGHRRINHLLRLRRAV